MKTRTQISLTDFVDFVIKNGMPRLTKVREIKDRDDYHPYKDFWRQVRDGISEMHSREYSTDYLDAIAQKQTDPRKIKRFPEAIASYKKFLGRKKVTWFDPPKEKWVMGDLTININPELGLVINDRPYLIKLFFKDEKLDKRKSEVVFHIMEEQLRYKVSSDTNMSILDVKSSKLLTPTTPPDNVSILLRAEANTFMQIWDAL